MDSPNTTMYDKVKFDACVDWYYANRDSLLPKYHGKYVVCADGKVIGAWGNFSLAAANAVDMGYKPGDFAVQHCVTEDEESRVRVYTPWVDFSKTGLSYQKTIEAKPLDDRHVAVTFANGAHGVFDFTPFADYPCYRTLRDAGIFALVRADHGTLMWPGEIDIAPEAVWEGSRIA